MTSRRLAGHQYEHASITSCKFLSPHPLSKFSRILNPSLSENTSSLFKYSATPPYSFCAFAKTAVQTSRRFNISSQHTYKTKQISSKKPLMALEHKPASSDYPTRHPASQLSTSQSRNLLPAHFRCIVRACFRVMHSSGTPVTLRISPATSPARSFANVQCNEIGQAV